MQSGALLWERSMGSLGKLFGLKQPASLAPGRGWTVPVVGESRFQTDLQTLYRKYGGTEHDIKVDAVFVPEDSNAFDANAVRVEIGSRTVGYLQRELAEQYRIALGRAGGQCSAKIVGGFELEDGTLAHFGVKLNLAWPPRQK
jgi:hypothetical protein